MTSKEILMLEASGKFRDEAHDSINQVRKYTGIPYKNHPRQVRETVLEYGGDVIQAIVADNHDVLEDVFPLNPFYSPERIGELFGKEVQSGVAYLTNVFTRANYPNWNRKTRHEAEAKRLGTIPARYATVKLADIKCNTADILVEDPEFAKVYLREKLGEINYLLHGDSRLWLDTCTQIEKGLRSL